VVIAALLMAMEQLPEQQKQQAAREWRARIAQDRLSA
jgi:phosphoglycerate dehydrogenase-like enzyme